MDESYFIYILDDISLFSPKRTIGSLRRYFSGYPFNEKSKEIISRVTKKKQLTEKSKLKLEELSEEQKKISTDFKSDTLSQSIIRNTHFIYRGIFVLYAISIVYFLIQILIKIPLSGNLKFLFFFLNLLAGVVMTSFFYFKKLNKIYFIPFLISLILFILLFTGSLYIFPVENYWIYAPVCYFCLFPFFLLPLSGLMSCVTLAVVKVLLKTLQILEAFMIKQKKLKRKKRLKEKKKEIEKKVKIIDKEILEVQKKLTDKQLDFIKELTQKYEHIFFPFTENHISPESEYDLLQGNLTIAAGDYISGLDIIRGVLGEKIKKFSAYNFWMGIIEAEKGNTEGVSKYFNNTFNITPLIAEPYMVYCFLNIKNNNLEIAEGIIKKEPLFSYDHPEKYFLKGLIMFLQENWDRAELELQKSLSLKPDDNTVKIILLLLFLKTKQYKKITSVIKDFKLSPVISEMFLGVSEYNQKNYKHAIVHFNNVLKEDKENIEAICYKEMARAQNRSSYKIFQEKHMAQKLISRFAGNIENEPVVYYTIARLYNMEDYMEQSREYFEKAYKLDTDNTLILEELAKFYINSPEHSVLGVEVLLKAIPLLEGKKRIFKKLLIFLLEQKSIPESIINLLEEQYFKNINYDPLLVEMLARHHLRKNTMNEKSTDIYLKAIEINVLNEKEKACAIKFVAFYDAESACPQESRIDIYRDLFKEYSNEERILFLNCCVFYKEKDMIKENPELFKIILQKKYLDSKFWNLFKLKRDFILINLVKYYKENKLYTEETMQLIEEAFDIFPRDKEILETFGEGCQYMGYNSEKALRAYKVIYRENPENLGNLVALGKAYLACNEIHADTITVLEHIFTNPKGLIWDEAIKIMTDYYIQKMEDGNLSKNLVVLSVWGHYTEIVPRDYRVRFYIAEEFFLQKEYLLAAQKYEEIISISPDHRDALFRLGECYLELKKIDKARDIFKRILNIRRDDLETLEKLARIYLELYKDEEEAIRHYEKAGEIDRKNMDYLKILLELYKKKSDPSNMIRIQEKITSLEPTGKNLATLGNFYLKTNNLKKGILRLMSAIQEGFYADGKVHLMVAEAKYCMLNERSSKREWIELIDILSEAIKLGCRDKKVYEIRYQVYLKIGDKKKAAEDRKVFAPDDLDNLYQLAVENCQDPLSVRENLLQIYRRDKDFLDVAIRLARIYAEEKSFNEKHIDIILYAFFNKTNQFLHNDEDNKMIDHIHNYYRGKSLFKEEIEFLNRMFQNKIPYREGKLKGWYAIALIETDKLLEAYHILSNISIKEFPDVLMDAHMRLTEELLFRENFKEAEEILEKMYLFDSTFKNAGNLLENLRRERLERFALLEVIGHGANATVYKAFDLVTRNYVAVKRLHPDLQSDEEALSNFKKEYNILEELIHPGIAKIIPGSFKENFFAIELLDKTLSMVLEKNKEGLELNEFFHIITQIIEALHYMHSKNIIYHDLAPDNVMFAGDIVKFCDLGGAKKFDLKSRQTIVGSTEKHYLYASPEQCKHEFDPSIKVDHRSDIYSLGILMYHMICGIPPFVGPDQALISAHQHSKPSPVLAQKDNIPRQLITIIFKSLEKDPYDRHQTMEELLQEIMQTPRN